MSPLQSSNLMSGMSGILGGLFGDSGSPYEAAMGQYQDYTRRAENSLNPFLSAGHGAIAPFQQWLSSMQNPSQFLNNLTNQYQESPFSKYQQQQAMRAAQNAASASGLSGSTPFMQQIQQNASNISSQDMNNWLSKVLGINTQYGAGNQSLINSGLGAGNALAGLYGDMGRSMAEAAYGKQAGENNDFSNLLGGALQLGMMFI